MAPSRRKQSLRLDVESLRAFREVVAQGGFTAASRALGVTQPAVSLKIRRLEERIGTSLILRDGHSFTLTADGQDLLARAEEIVKAHDQAVDRMQRSELTGTVRLGCNGEVAANGLSEVASRFRRTHPNIDLAIRVHHSVIVSELLDNDEIDVALITLLDVEGAVRPTDEVWRRDEMHIVQGIEADFDDEDPVPVVAFGPSSVHYTHLVALLDAAGRTHRVSMEWGNLKGLKSAIEAGLGVGLLSTRNITERMKPWTGIGPIKLPASVFVMRSRPNADADELIGALRDHLSAALASTYRGATEVQQWANSPTPLTPSDRRRVES